MAMVMGIEEAALNLAPLDDMQLMRLLKNKHRQQQAAEGRREGLERQMEVVRGAERARENDWRVLGEQIRAIRDEIALRSVGVDE